MSDKVGLDIEKISQVVEPILEDMGFELVGIDYITEHGRWVLRILADKDGGITLDDCAGLSRQIGSLMDIKDIIQHEYVLEVSSPGLNRPLVKEKDFLRSIGKKVKILMISSIEGRRRFTGYLTKFQDGTLYMDVDDKLVSLLWQDVEKANIVYEFEKGWR